MLCRGVLAVSPFSNVESLTATDPDFFGHSLRRNNRIALRTRSPNQATFVRSGHAIFSSKTRLWTSRLIGSYVSEATSLRGASVDSMEELFKILDAARCNEGVSLFALAATQLMSPLARQIPNPVGLSIPKRTGSFQHHPPRYI